MKKVIIILSLVVFTAMCANAMAVNIDRSQKKIVILPKNAPVFVYKKEKQVKKLGEMYNSIRFGLMDKREAIEEYKLSEGKSYGWALFANITHALKMPDDTHVQITGILKGKSIALPGADFYVAKIGNFHEFIIMDASDMKEVVDEKENVDNQNSGRYTVNYWPKLSGFELRFAATNYKTGRVTLKKNIPIWIYNQGAGVAKIQEFTNNLCSMNVTNENYNLLLPAYYMSKDSPDDDGWVEDFLVYKAYKTSRNNFVVTEHVKTPIAACGFVEYAVGFFIQDPRTKFMVLDVDIEK